MKHKTITKISKRMWLALNYTLMVIYLIWRIFWTLPVEYGILSMIFGVILLVVEILGGVEAVIHFWNMYNVENLPLPVVPDSEMPHVDVFIATYNEPEELLWKTVNGCIHMDYPDKSKVHIYVCDDNRRANIREMAVRMGVNYLDRPDNKGAKAGNLNHALSVSTSPYVVTLDADMIPRHDFLLDTIPYFVDNEIKNRSREESDRVKMGLIQSPQAFYNPDLFQYNLYSEGRIPNEQDYFYRDVQVARNKSNSVIYGGSNTVIAREALEEIGGFYTGSITEDFATGILIQKKKYKCIAINTVLASGLAPNTLKDLIQQRVRWGRGVIATARKMHLIVSPHLTIAQKLNYMASVWYWYSPIKILIYLMAPILYAVFGYTVIKCSLLQILVFWLPMYLVQNITLQMLSGNIRTTKWSRVYETIMFPFLFVPILMESFGISTKTFKVTSKNTATGKTNNYAYVIPFLVFLVLTVIGIVRCVVIMFETSSLSLLVVLFWLIANFFSLFMATFFVDGRQMFRKNERVTAAVECTLQDKFESVTCVTKDISEGGFSLLLDTPLYIKEDDEVAVTLHTDRYQAKLYGKIVLVHPLKDIWKYSFMITRISDDSRSEYMQILYDRIPTMPQEISLTASSFHDLQINMTKRVKPVNHFNRKLARIPLNVTLPTVDNQYVKLIDFNYIYLAVEGTQARQTMMLEPIPGVMLSCDNPRVIRSGVILYTVENIEELYSNPAIRANLIEWLKKEHLEKTDEMLETTVAKKAHSFNEADSI